MPLYEYCCRECRHRFEVLQRMGEGADGLQCPTCSSEAVAKQFSTFAASSGNGSQEASCSQPGCGSAGFT